MRYRKKRPIDLPKAFWGTLIGGVWKGGNALKNNLTTDGNDITQDTTGNKIAMTAGNIMNPFSGIGEAWKSDMSTKDKLLTSYEIASGIGVFGGSNRLLENRNAKESRDYMNTQRGEEWNKTLGNVENYNLNIPTFAMGGNMDEAQMQQMQQMQMQQQQQQGQGRGAMNGPMDGTGPRGQEQQEVDMIQGNRHEQGGTNIANIVEAEKGEAKAGKVVYSDRLKITKSDAKEYDLPKAYVGKTIAQVAELIDKQFGLRKFDSLDKKEKKNRLDILASIQEDKKQDMSNGEFRNNMEGAGLPISQEMEQGLMQQSEQSIMQNEQQPQEVMPQMAYGGTVPPGSRWSEVNGQIIPAELNTKELLDKYAKDAYNSGHLPRYGADNKWGNEFNASWKSYGKEFLSNQVKVNEGTPPNLNTPLKFDIESQEVRVNSPYLSNVLNEDMSGIITNNTPSINSNKLSYIPEDNDLDFIDEEYEQYISTDDAGNREFADKNSPRLTSGAIAKGATGTSTPVDEDGNMFNYKQPNQFMTNAGNYYDIARGIVGMFKPEKKFDRVSPEYQRAAYVDSGRSLEELSGAFGTARTGVAENTRGIGSYLSNMIALGSAEAKGRANVSQKYDEANVGIENRVRAANAQAGMNAQQQNASIQRYEEDINQRERDVASNMIQSGLSNSSELYMSKVRSKNKYEMDLAMLQAMRQNNWRYTKKGMEYINTGND